MMINKRIALSMLTIVGTLMAVVGITYAAFTTTVTLSENTLSTGDVDVQIASLSSPTGSCSGFGDSITGVATSNVLPGGSGNRYFCLRNISSTTGTVLNMTAKASVLDPEVGQEANQLDKSLVTVGVMCGTPGADLDESTATVVPVVLDNENESASISLVPKESTVGASTVKCRITQTLSDEATDTAKGKTISYDVVFTGAQDTDNETPEVE